MTPSSSIARSSPRTRFEPSCGPSVTVFLDLFPGRTHVPKTLIFAKDDSHADDIVQIVREEFGKGTSSRPRSPTKRARKGKSPSNYSKTFGTATIRVSP